MVRFASRTWLVSCVGWLLLAGCAGHYTVVQQTMPTPYHRSSLFEIEPVHFDGTLMGRFTEADWLGRRSVSQRARWDADKDAFARRFIGGLITRGQPFVFTVGAENSCGVVDVRTNVEAIQPGRYSPPWLSGDTDLRLRVQLAQCGAVLDEFVIDLTVRSSTLRAALGTRMRIAGERASKLLYRYLMARTTATG